MVDLFTRFDPTKLGGSDAVVVFGLGRFGSALAQELMDNNVDVLGIDSSEELVQSLSGQLTHVVQADATKPEVLDQLGVADYGRAVIAIGSDIEASILIASQLIRLGVKDLWAKAVSAQHGLILEQIGVTHVVWPEADMGRRVAHLVLGALDDYAELSPGFVCAQVPAPEPLFGRALGEHALNDNHGIAIVAVHRSDDWFISDPATVLQAGDKVLVLGDEGKVEKFARSHRPRR